MGDAEAEDDDVASQSVHKIAMEDKEATAKTNEDGRMQSSISGITRRLSNMTIVSTPTSVCSLVECSLGKSKYMLECSKCKKTNSLHLYPTYTISSCIIHAKGLQIIRLQHMRWGNTQRYTRKLVSGIKNGRAGYQ